MIKAILDSKIIVEKVEQIKRCIQRGSKIRQTDGYLASYPYIKVAYKKKGDVYKIKTVYVE